MKPITRAASAAFEKVTCVGQRKVIRNKLARVLAALAALAAFALATQLAGCANKPVPPEWQANAHGALKDFAAAYLTGNSRVAGLDFARAKSEIASTGRADLIARAELVRCAVRVASLEFDSCAGLQGLGEDADSPERAYAAFLTGRWQGVQGMEGTLISLLPAHHRAVVSAKDEAGKNAALAGIKDPLAQLVAAGVLFQAGQLAPSSITAAVNTASAQGWRRPLLAWLGVQAQRAGAAGDMDAKARIQRRIDLVSSNPAGNP